MICPPASPHGVAEASFQSPQTYPSTPSQHGTLLQGPGRPRHVALAGRPGGESWQETVVKVPDLADVLPCYAGVPNAYMSPQRFWGCRRIAGLAECRTLAQDIDFRKIPALGDCHPRGVLEDVRIALEDAKNPQPSLAIASGQHKYVLWPHEPIPRGALPRWNACQKEMWKVLKPFSGLTGRHWTPHGSCA
jgi:hypothetical protein